MSSDFSYEDILKWQVDDYDYTRVGQGPCPAGTCTMVEAKPRNRYSSYTLLKVYYDDGLSDQQGRLFREQPGQAAQDARAQPATCGRARSWQPSRSVMTNHETETSTQIVWSGYQIDTPIDERIMTPSSIGR